MAKKLQKKFMVDLGGVSLGKKDTAKLSASFTFSDSGLDANGVQALLAGGALHCRFDKGAGNQHQLPLAKKDMPPVTIELDGICHRISMDMTTCSFGVSFPKTAMEANQLAAFAGETARLTVTRTGDLDGADEEEEQGDGKEE
jgi:hypothetical protein